MIVPDRPATAAHVAVHYDELDLAYRRMWGDHVHHGYWRSGKETPQEAAAALVVLVEEHLALRPGHRVCDIGCGYGATAAAILGRHDVTIVGLTLSAAQQRIADGRAPGFACGPMPSKSSEHMTDKGCFFTEARASSSLCAPERCTTACSNGKRAE